MEGTNTSPRDARQETALVAFIVSYMGGGGGGWGIQVGPISSLHLHMHYVELWTILAERHCVLARSARNVLDKEYPYIA